jgi:predicted RNA-binding protein with PUA-like domain
MNIKMAKNYWLFKTDPAVFSLEDLKKCKNQTTCWDGVRNYQARNFIRDEMKTGDDILFYCSQSEPNAVFGICTIVKNAYPDPSQFNPKDKHYFPSSDPENPSWYAVDIKYMKGFKNPVSLSDIKANTKLKNMRLVQKGSRLSVMPVTKQEFDEVLKMGG